MSDLDKPQPDRQIRGPVDLVFMVEPYTGGYVWKIRNDSLKSISELRNKGQGCAKL